MAAQHRLESRGTNDLARAGAGMDVVNRDDSGVGIVSDRAAA